jgi:hypothetical protein
MADRATAAEKGPSSHTARSAVQQPALAPGMKTAPGIARPVSRRCGAMFRQSSTDQWVTVPMARTWK